MGSSPCDPNKDNSGIKEWVGFGATLYGGLIDSVQIFLCQKLLVPIQVSQRLL